MGDQVLIKDRQLKVINPQKKKIITPDVILHTRNVMIPVVRRVLYKQSFNIPFTEDRPQILKTQNYKNNPALLFSETLSRTLRNPLENFFKVKRVNHKKFKNQSTRYPVSGKIDSPCIRKTSILQNSSLLKKLLCKEKNTLHFPNTTLGQFVPLTNEKDLRKTSSKSIKLSRKCDLLQIKDQIKYENKFAVMPKIETPVISNIISKSSAVSLPSQSFCDITESISTISTLSVSSFKIENKKTYANIVNKKEKKSISRIASNYLHSDNSEHEINVLHYNNDIVPGNNFPHFTQSCVKCTNTNWSFTNNSTLVKIQNDYENLADKKSTIESQCRWNTDKAVRDIKYLWEVNDLMPFFQSKEHNACEVKNIEKNSRKAHDCKIKYSWQVIGTSTQTSYTLLQDLLNNINTEDNKPYKMCSIKYSWQIIGISTQASLHNYDDLDYWSGMLLIPNKNYNENNVQIGDNETNCTKLRNHTKYPEGRLKKYLILNNQQTQTCAEKEIQVETNDNYAKYSWHNLIKQYQ